jgi:hypothetical protein
MPVVLGLIAVATLVPIVRATLAPTAHAAQDLPVYATVHVHAGLVLIVLATWDLPVIVLLEPTVSAREVLNAVVVLIQVALVMVRVSAIRVPTVFVDWAPTAHVRLVPHARAAPVRHAHLFSPLNLLMLQPIVSTKIFFCKWPLWQSHCISSFIIFIKLKPKMLEKLS